VNFSYEWASLWKCPTKDHMLFVKHKQGAGVSHETPCQLPERLVVWIAMNQGQL
jgi:hypothetical protein